MPTRPEGSPASATAAAEAASWLKIADAIPLGWGDVVPTELAVIGYHDPAEDLERRARAWGHRLPDFSLGSLAIFAAGLARAEADAWQADEPHVATQAYAARRFLLSDRIVHWAVPWADAAGRCYPDHRAATHEARDLMLAIGDTMRPEPDLGAAPGATLPDHDGYGPSAEQNLDATHLRSLWSGAVLLDATLRSLIGDASGLLQSHQGREDLASLYEVAGARWRGIAQRHPGTAGLWRTLAERADRTEARLRA